MKTGYKRETRMTTGQTFICGAISAKTVTSPLDVIKLYAQVGLAESRQGVLSSIPIIYRKEGLKAFWKGNFVACTKLLPWTMVQFWSGTAFKRWFGDTGTGRMTIGYGFIAGIFSGMAATVLTYPIDTIRVRLALNHTMKSRAKYRGAIHCVATMLREEGFRSLYRGVVIATCGLVPYSFGAVVVWYGLSWWNWEPKEVRTPQETFVFGCLASFLAHQFSYPWTTIQRLQQMNGPNVPLEYQPDIKADRARDVYKKLLRAHGAAGLWRGVSAGIYKIVPHAVLITAAYQFTRNIFYYLNGYTMTPWKDVPIDGVPQNLTPYQLQKWYRTLEHYKESSVGSSRYR